MQTDTIEVHAHPTGSVFGNGSLGYPVQGLHAAIRLVRQRRAPGQRAIVWVHPGVYRQTDTLELGPVDSYTTFAAFQPGSETVIQGSAALTDWKAATLRGHPVWVADAPASSARSLFVAGERRPRPRWPRQGFLRIDDVPGLDVRAEFVSTLFDGADSFRYAAGDLPELADPTAVEVVVPHYWLQERMPIGSIDRDARTLTSPFRSIFALRDDAAHRFAKYYLDNVAEAFGAEPGEWYLDQDGALDVRQGAETDTSSGASGAGAARSRVVYLPKPGEHRATFVAEIPVLGQFVRVEGDVEPDAPVREVRFEGIAFRYADWATVPASRPPYGVREDPVLPTDVDYAAGPQAASEVPASIEFAHARSCAFIDGAIEHVGGYGIRLSQGTRGSLVSRSRFTDLGAGAVVSGGSADPASPLFNRANAVLDNEIHRGGRVYPHCVAVLFQHGSHNTIAHNHISDFFYTGISVGWVWDYEESPSHSNTIEGNHIHTLGQGLLNDMGGVYLLGIAPGTVVRGNHIHDIECANYGGWGIYLDEGSSHVVVEDNVVHSVSSQCYHHHYGREVQIRNNVFAFGAQGQVSITRPEGTVSFTLERNILLGDGSPGFSGTPGPRDVREYTVISDLNLFWDVRTGGAAALAANGLKDGDLNWSVVESLDDDWRASGHDTHSVVADPLFVDARSGDFELLEQSPAGALGFRGVDAHRTAGPRSRPAAAHPLADRIAVVS